MYPFNPIRFRYSPNGHEPNRTGDLTNGFLLFHLRSKYFSRETATSFASITKQDTRINKDSTVSSCGDSPQRFGSSPLMLISKASSTS